VLIRAFVKAVHSFLFQAAVWVVALVAVHALLDESYERIPQFGVIAERTVQQVQGFGDHAVEIEAYLKVVVEVQIFGEGADQAVGEVIDRTHV